LQLGEAVAVLLLSRSGGSFRIAAVASETEGQSVTRPSNEGHSLARVGKKVLEKYSHHVDAVIAHGTGTSLNDKSEDQALASVLGEFRTTTPVTSTKWCVGHTLGASGVIDLIAALEILRSQSFFKIHATVETEPAFKLRYLTKNSELPTAPVGSVLVTSLGFGGVHAALVVEKAAHGS
jgi:3-oxoacyl-(acyl-carrier-protein) synthase